MSRYRNFGEWVIIYAIVAAVAWGLLAVGLWVVLP